MPGVFFQSRKIAGMIKTNRQVVILLVIAGLAVLLIAGMIRLTPDSPVNDMEYARLLLIKAGTTKAVIYSKELYSEARAAYDSAMLTWHLENRRLIFLRDYRKVRAYALRSAEKAERAVTTSVTNSYELVGKVEAMLGRTEKMKIAIDSLFGRYPFSPESRLKISDGKMLLREGRIDYENELLPDAYRKVTEAEQLLSSVYKNTANELKDYFSSYTTWQELIRSALRESKQKNCYSIVIDKYAKKCYLYYSGKRKYAFEAELGLNWIGNKRRRGDKATPEGIYRVEKKYQGRATPYHKSLRLDYPNSDDMKRFKQDVGSGAIPSTSIIGGGIELHGGGGKGVDWTDGCIALADADIDILFKLAEVGTQVTIVGSMRNYEEIFPE
jgi:hypothetical protein